ncbi:MAG: haloalkane dehalogenase [Deltaproteobacteria bacterium]|nr:haloalkane dehalogenase [Deltaproteobacteria bacterium]MBW2718999.1 haloalkane dehalogenase [Deltaproteobacteria bacterium]RLB47266.1 MAG: haloalkane dehalogenase [Deltaproteobacteria bacterium]
MARRAQHHGSRDFVRTPDERFENLPDYPFTANYFEVDGLRMHYVDEGPRDASPVLLLHGEPSWSFLYRHMIPALTDAGHRAIAIDLIGFGKSDKPTRQTDYTVARHVGWLQSLIDHLALEDITLFGQDWGSTLGLLLATTNDERFSRIVIGNGLLHGKDGLETKRGLVHLWRAFTRWSPWVPVGQVVSRAAGRLLTEAERRAYDAPFPSREFLAGVRAFPQLIPMSSKDPATPANVAAWQALARWNKPFLTVYSDGDPILGDLDVLFQQRVPGAHGQPHVRLEGGHFLQEVSGPEIARRIHDLIAAT